MDRTICVQTQHNLQENRWALALADRHASIAGVVIGSIYCSNCNRQLAEFTPHPKFIGVRHVTQMSPDDDFIVRPDVIRGLRVLEKLSVPFDLLLYVKHLRHVPMPVRHPLHIIEQDRPPRQTKHSRTSHKRLAAGLSSGGRLS